MKDKLETHKISAHTDKNITLLFLDKSPEENAMWENWCKNEGFYYLEVVIFFLTIINFLKHENILKRNVGKILLRDLTLTLSNPNTM